MTTNHTPGPWWVDGRRYRCAVVGFNRNGDYALIRCADPAIEDSYASLIAAAPDLLAALAEVTRCLAWHVDNGRGVAMDAKAVTDARAAIAKAEGRP